MRFLLKTRQDTIRWGRAFGSLLQSGDVIALIGDLGSGKTTLTQAVATGLGIIDPVTSPTFSLIQEYSGTIPLYHFDPYRLDHPEEIAELGLDEYLQREGVVIVEWADLIAPLLPIDRFEIRINIRDTETMNYDSNSAPRSLCITGTGARPARVAARLLELPDAALLVDKTGANNAG